jgi:hypothetical protein
MPQQHSNAISRRRSFAVCFTVFACISWTTFGLSKSPDGLAIAATWSSLAIGFWVAYLLAINDSN